MVNPNSAIVTGRRETSDLPSHNAGLNRRNKSRDCPKSFTLAPTRLAQQTFYDACEHNSTDWSNARTIDIAKVYAIRHRQQRREDKKTEPPSIFDKSEKQEELCLKEKDQYNCQSVRVSRKN